MKPHSDPARPLSPSTPMEIIAHRGASYVAPENTVAAYTIAWEMGVDAAETDIYLTRDGQVVAIHDPTTKRTCGTDLEIKSSTYEEIAMLDAGRWKDPKYAGERIPRLTDILATVPPGKSLYVEIKCGAEILPALESVLHESGKRGQVILIGFDLSTMVEAKKRLPDVPGYWLRETREDKQTQARLPHDPKWIVEARAKGLDGLDVQYGGMTREFVEAARQAGLRVTVWTVNEPAVARRMLDLGVDGLTTDQPDLIRESL